MYLLYDTKFEGVGAQYQRILCLLSLAKRHNLKYIHKKITVDHNYDNDSEWDDKWDKFFNISKISYKGIVDMSNIIKYDSIDSNILNNIINSNNVYSICTAYNIIDKDPNAYYKLIQDDIINAYEEVNADRKLMYLNNRTSIAIHIRVYNSCDEVMYRNFDNFRHPSTDIEYYKLINNLKNMYDNADIYIFSQKNFDEKYSILRDIPDIKILLDYDTFDTFNHLCKADILIMGTSSYSYLAGLYNKNTVIYYNFWHPPLDNWKNFNDYIK